MISNIIKYVLYTIAWVQSRIPNYKIQKWLGEWSMDILLYMCKNHNWTMRVIDEDSGEI